MQGECDCDVLVIGAGMAGLAAAHDVTDQLPGTKVIVLEGRERVGGRTWTTQDVGVPIDLGASWFHGLKKNPVYELAKSLDVNAVEGGPDGSETFDFDGTPISKDTKDKVKGEVLLYSYQVFQHASTLEDAHNHTIGDSIEQLKELSNFEAESELEGRLFQWQHCKKELWAATALRNMSLATFSDSVSFPGGDWFCKEGFSVLVDHLAQPLDVRLSHDVTRVQHAGHGDHGDDFAVHVTCANGAVFRAQQVVVTVPLGVLKANHITFDPALGPAKQRAIELLGMGVLDKVVLRFPEVVWNPSLNAVNYVSKTPNEWPYFLNMAPLWNQPILIAFVSGDFARSIEALTDAEVVDSVMQVLRRVYPTIGDPVSHAISRWASDPFSRGSYSHLGRGATGSLCSNLGSPENASLYFAGEAATRQYRSTASGAYVSGQAAARAVVKARAKAAATQ